MTKLEDVTLLAGGLPTNELEGLIEFAKNLKAERLLPDAKVEENTDHRFGKVYGITSPKGESLCDRDIATEWGFKDWDTMFRDVVRTCVKKPDDIATFQYIGQNGVVLTDTFFYNKEDAELCLKILRTMYIGE